MNTVHWWVPRPHMDYTQECDYAKTVPSKLDNNLPYYLPNRWILLRLNSSKDRSCISLVEPGDDGASPVRPVPHISQTFSLPELSNVHASHLHVWSVSRAILAPAVPLPVILGRCRNKLFTNLKGQLRAWLKPLMNCLTGFRPEYDAFNCKYRRPASIPPRWPRNETPGTNICTRTSSAQAA